MKKILYTGAFKYPDGDAAGKRVHSIIDSLSDFYDFTVTNWGGGNGKYDYNELDLTGRWMITKLIMYYFMGIKTFIKIRKELDSFDAVILYNPPFIFSIIMLIICKIKSISIVLESTEWYESTSFPGGKYGPLSFENWLRMRVSYPLFSNVIVMSDFMREYFHKKNIIKIPPFSHYHGKIKKDDTDNDIITFIYAGSPGKKDRLDIIVKDLLNLEKGVRDKIKLLFVGFSLEQFVNLYPDFKNNQKQVMENVEFTGRVKMAEVKKYYQMSDYSIFFRENKRYALAGFPSKFVESLSYLTPVITNPVGDISKIIYDYGYSYDNLLFLNIVKGVDNNHIKNIHNNIVKSFLDDGFFSVTKNKLKLKSFLDGVLNDK
ncbi:glycosyltransferase [Photobacterium damselae]|uniref:glycosyltransferase n=1 Tax=Photobacterium damselae TaxID=38293 RepID=UPI004067A25A